MIILRERSAAAFLHGQDPERTSARILAATRLLFGTGRAAASLNRRQEDGRRNRSNGSAQVYDATAGKPKMVILLKGETK
jgi:hypothetical protein